MPAYHGQGRPRPRQPQVLAGSMMYTVSPEQLRAFVRATENDENTDDSNLDGDPRQRVLVLDCRSFVAYNAGHVLDSVNVHCPAILRRRCGGRLPLRTLIPNSAVRTQLANNRCFPVVLYDEYGPGSSKGAGPELHDESTAAFVAKCLRTELDLKVIYYLEGGYQSFSSLYPSLVTREPLLVAPSPGRSPSPSPGGGGPVEILPHLFLGSARDASRREQLQQLGVTALLNVTRLCPNLSQGVFQYKCIPVRDTGCEDIAAHFHEAIGFIDQVKAQKGKVLVHCQAGISRSATICIAYLMHSRRLRMEEAYAHVKARRRIVSPNFSFMGQLLSFEDQVFSATPPAPRYRSAPSSPRLAVDAQSPHPDALTPSRGAQQTVFDFAAAALPLSLSAPDLDLAAMSEFTPALDMAAEEKLTLSSRVT